MSNNTYNVTAYNKNNERIDTTYQPTVTELVEFIETITTLHT